MCTHTHTHIHTHAHTHTHARTHARTHTHKQIFLQLHPAITDPRVTETRPKRTKKAGPFMLVLLFSYNGNNRNPPLTDKICLSLNICDYGVQVYFELVIAKHSWASLELFTSPFSINLYVNYLYSFVCPFPVSLSVNFLCLLSVYFQSICPYIFSVLYFYFFVSSFPVNLPVFIFCLSVCMSVCLSVCLSVFIFRPFFTDENWDEPQS